MKHSVTGASLAGLLLAGSLIWFVPGPGLHAGTDNSRAGSPPEKSLQGSWTTQLQRRDCQTGEPTALPGRGLITFATGGTLIETAAGAVAGGFRGPGHGVWERNGAREYSATFVIQLLNADGSFAAWLKSMQVIELSKDGDEFTSTASVEVTNPQGTVIQTGCATSVGTRIQ
jgi:hypothetical protein